MTRLAAIGLDAAEWTLIQRLLDEGELPNLRKLRAESAYCRLDNVVAYRSELPWTLFLTGKDPQSNRYWSSVQFEPSTYGTYRIPSFDGRPFYAIPGKKVISFDVPHTTLAGGVEGIQITAWGAHSAHYPRASKPAGLLREIDQRFGPHPGFDNDYDGSWYQPKFLDALGEALMVGARRRVEIARWLQTEKVPDWDLLITVMSESHSGGHHFWHGVDEKHPLFDSHTKDQAREWLLRVYRALDDAVGDFAAALPDNSVLAVFAVHGMQPNNNDLPSMVLLPELLFRLQFGEGLLLDPNNASWRKDGYRPTTPEASRKWISYMKDRFADSPAERRRRAVRLNLPEPIMRLKRNLQWRLRGRSMPMPPWELVDPPAETELDPQQIQQVRESLDWQVTNWYQRHWPKMRAFVLPTFSDAHVRINLIGREGRGIVALEDYERVCKEIEDTVRACRNPRTGNPVVQEVIWMRADDPMAPDGPDSDLVIVWTEAIDAFEHPDVGVIGPFPFLRTGEHSSHGFALFSGPGIEPGDLGQRSAYDLTPTFIELLGGQPPEDLAGKSIFGHPH